MKSVEGKESQVTTTCTSMKLPSQSLIFHSIFSGIDYPLKKYFKADY